MQAILTSRRVLIGLALVLGVNSQLNAEHLRWVGKVPNAIVKTLADPPASLMRSVAAGVQGEPPDETYVPEGQDTEDLRASIARAELLNRQLWEENRDLRRLLEAEDVTFVGERILAVHKWEARA